MAPSPTDATPLDSSFYERLLGTADVPEAAIRASCAVVPWRRTEAGHLEVYWVRRAASMRFMGGWWAFPGGGVSRRDAPAEERLDGESLRSAVSGVDPDTHTRPDPDLSDEELRELGPDLAPGVVFAALRELFEETGLLLASGGDIHSKDLEDERRRLLAKETTFGEILDAHDLRPDASALVFAGRWLTPPFAPMRFDNRFFLLEWPADRDPQPTLAPVDEGGELDRGEWIEPERALLRWLEGDGMAAPPILHVLRVLAEDGPGDGSASPRRLLDTTEADLGPFRRIEFRPGVILLPLETPTLPPARHTNAFLLGRRETVIVDPATSIPEERERFLAALDAAVRRGHELCAIWLSHHHPDHVGAVEAVRERFDLPVLAHPATAERLAGRVPVDAHLEDGQRIVLDGDPRLPIVVHHTPGHAPGHLCFYDERYGTLLAGDLVSTLSTIVVDPSEGDMDDYLDSLERMAALDARSLFPSHGPGTLEPTKLLRRFHRHRLDREKKILAAYRDGRVTPAAMVAEVYDDAPVHVHPVAERQIQAHLDRLAARGLLDGSGDETPETER